MKIVFLSALILILCACASSPASERITTVPANEMTLAEVVENPVLFEGSTVRWGGRVLEAEKINNNGEDLLSVVIVDYPLDERGKPLTEASPGLRFMVHIREGEQTLEELKEKVFKRNSFVTVFGWLHGEQSLDLTNGKKQQLPTIVADDYHRWSYRSNERLRSNGITFGIGIGITL